MLLHLYLSGTHADRKYSLEREKKSRTKTYCSHSPVALACFSEAWYNRPKLYNSNPNLHSASFTCKSEKWEHFHSSLRILNANKATWRKTTYSSVCCVCLFRIDKSLFYIPMTGQMRNATIFLPLSFMIFLCFLYHVWDGFIMNILFLLFYLGPEQLISFNGFLVTSVLQTSFLRIWHCFYFWKRPQLSLEKLGRYICWLLFKGYM